MRVGLDPVQNLSRSGLRPREDDQDSLENAESAEVTKSYEFMHAYVRPSWEVLGLPREL